MRRDAQMYRAWLGPRTATEISRPYIRPESQVAEPEHALLVGSAVDPLEGDSVEIERALTSLGVMSAGATPS